MRSLFNYEGGNTTQEQDDDNDDDEESYLGEDMGEGDMSSESLSDS